MPAQNYQIMARNSFATNVVILGVFILGSLSGGLLVIHLWSSTLVCTDPAGATLLTSNALSPVASEAWRRFYTASERQPSCTYDPFRGIHVVTACSKNHVREVLDMIDSFQQMWKSRTNPGPSGTETLHLHIFILKDDVSQEIIDTYLKTPCDFVVTIEKFDYAWLGFRDHNLTQTVNERIRGLTNSLWKPTVLRRVANSIGPCQLIFWCDASVRFGKAFGPSRVWDQVARTNGLAVQYQLERHHETIPSVTHPMTFKMLSQLTRGRVSPNIMDYRNVPTYAASFQIWYTGNLQVMNVLEDLANCALVKECMAPEGSSGYTGYGGCHHDFEGHCHRGDQAVLSILAYEYVKDLGEGAVRKNHTDGERLLPDLREKVLGESLIYLIKHPQESAPRFCDAAGKEMILPKVPV